MSAAGKAVTNAYYGRQRGYSYFNGCSTGGREGLMEAQKYPADYNGIVSGAPAINWTKFIPAEIWPELVMNQSHDFLPSCKENAFTESAVQACGTTDGVITNPDTCDWNHKQARRLRDAVRRYHAAGRRGDDEDLARAGNHPGPQALVRA